MDSAENIPNFKPIKIKDMERIIVLRSLDYFEWNKAKTARALGISYRKINYLLKRYEVQGYDFQESIELYYKRARNEALRYLDFKFNKGK